LPRRDTLRRPAANPALYTLNPAVLLVSTFVVAVHHKIVLAEEQHLSRVFGDEYAHYRRRVRRYV
jgi:protein-S-isoprenylcysteine O-methyltransferase Ste14